MRNLMRNFCAGRWWAFGWAQTTKAASPANG